MNKINKNICSYYVNGMHCAACEVLIEKKLLENKNVVKVDVSLAKKRVDIEYNEQQPKISSLNKLLKKDGYQLYSDNFKETNHSSFISFNNGDIYINPLKAKNAGITLLIFIVLIFLFFLLEKSGLSQFVSVSASSSLPVFFALGILAGVSSCAALTGGLLLSLSKQWSEKFAAEDSSLKRLQPFTMFNIGRIFSFFALGGVLGLSGSLLGINLTESNLSPLLVILVSIVMLILGLQMLGIEWVNKFQLHMPKFIARKATKDKLENKYMPLISGFLTFFLPCGFTLIAQGIALTSGSFISGSLIMLAFALGTLPMLALISFSSVKFNSNPKLSLRFNKVAGLLVLFFALYNINSQLNVLGIWSLSDININQNNQVFFDQLNDVSEQQIKLIAKGFEYKLAGSTVLKAGVKTTLEIDNQGIYGCGTYLAAKGLLNNYIQLQPGINKVEFVPQKGTYKITCSMGMVPPVTITVV